MWVYLRDSFIPVLVHLHQKNQLIDFENILADHDHIKAALSSDRPVVMGLMLYPSFESREVARTGRCIDWRNSLDISSNPVVLMQDACRFRIPIKRSVLEGTQSRL